MQNAGYMGRASNVALFRQMRDSLREMRRIVQMLRVQALQLSWPRNSSETHPIHVSLIVPAYNVGPYLDAFFESLFAQTGPFGGFEVIVVDDGSTDDTSTIVAAWLKRYPSVIRVYAQKNAGAAAARNVGLTLARGAWVGFPDPDDLLHPDYFAQMCKATRKVFVKPLIAVVSNLIFYHEDGKYFADSHPLRYRFEYGKVHKTTNNLDQHVVLSAATCWFHRDTITQSGIVFDPRVVPAFEDAHFINRLFLAAPERTVTFVPKAKYFYRKRAAQTSQLDLAKTHPGWFCDQLSFGYLDLLKYAQNHLGTVPSQVQRTCLYPLVWQFRTLIKEPERAAFLSDEQRLTYLALLNEIFTYIDAETIKKFDLARCTEEHKVGLLARYKGQQRKSTRVYAQSYDATTGHASFSYFTGSDDPFALQAYINNTSVACYDPIAISHTFMGQPYITEHTFWVPFHKGQTLTFTHHGVASQVWRRSLKLGLQIRLPMMRLALKFVRAQAR
jgi:glycosyltransferase involved in cell wall biosynthesis